MKPPPTQRGFGTSGERHREQGDHQQEGERQQKVNREKGPQLLLEEASVFKIKHKRCEKRFPSGHRINSSFIAPRAPLIEGLMNNLEWLTFCYRRQNLDGSSCPDPSGAQRWAQRLSRRCLVLALPRVMGQGR